MRDKKCENTVVAAEVANFSGEGAGCEVHPHASQTPPAREAAGLQHPQAAPDAQATADLSETAMEEWQERVRLAQLEQLHKRLSDSRGQAQLDARRAGEAAPGHSSTPHTSHKQSACSRGVSGTCACALRASIERSRKPRLYGQFSTPPNPRRRGPLKLYERLLLVLHPIRQWLPSPVRQLVVRTYLMASILSSVDRAARQRKAKEQRHA
ncbi:hypothetical protein D9M68_524540 [compost metagenome]